METLFRPFAIWSGFCLTLSMAFHCLALFDLIQVGDDLGFAFVVLSFLLILPGQVILIIGANGGELNVLRRRAPSGRAWRYLSSCLNCIPKVWRILGLSFWYVYMPVVGIVCVVRENTAAFFGLIVSAFFLLHFLAYQFVLPRRDELKCGVEKLPK